MSSYDFISYNESYSGADGFFHKLHSMLNSDGPDRGSEFFFKELAPIEQNFTKSSQLLVVNSPEVSTDNSENSLEKFMPLGNMGRFDLSEETSIGNSIGPESPSESLTMSTEDKPIAGKTESGQSIFKNKYKETLEQAKAIYDELAKLISKVLGDIKKWNAKTETEWEQEGQKLDEKIQAYEKAEREVSKVKSQLEFIQIGTARQKSLMKDLEKVRKNIKELVSKAPTSKKEVNKVEKHLEKARNEENKLLAERAELQKRLENITVSESELKKEEKRVVKILEAPKKALLEQLKIKRLARFAPLLEFMGEIQEYANKSSTSSYFEAYKKKRSMKYFGSYMKEEELYYWIVMFKIALLLIPKQKETIQLLPLKKETLPMMSWMIESSIMKAKHKNLFKEFYVRSHLRTEFTRVCNTLLISARNMVETGKWTQEKWTSLQKVLNAVEEVPELFLESTSAPMAQDMIFDEDFFGDSNLKRCFDYNSESTDFDEDHNSEGEKRVFYGGNF